MLIMLFPLVSALRVIHMIINSKLIKL